MRGPHSHRAFTLIELLLVLAVIGIITVVTIPNFARSMRGSRLRVATRTVVMAGRYARSMAVLRQADMAVTFDLDAWRVAVQPLRSPAPEPAESESEEASEDNGPVAAEPAPPPAPAAGEGGRGDMGEVELTRDLEGVRIVGVSTGDEEGDRTAGQVTVIYRNNGRCTPYTVRLADEDDLGVTVAVDALASAVTEPLTP